MSITDELREYTEEQVKCLNMTKAQYYKLFAIADRIDAEHEKALDEQFKALTTDMKPMTYENMAADGWIRLPVDADGEVIHIGDVMERGEARGSVIALMLSNYPKKWGGALHWGIQLDGEHAPTALDLMFHHYHAPTVEDVLREMHAELDEVTALYVGEAIDSDERDSDEARIFAKYAKRLTLAGDDE